MHLQTLADWLTWLGLVASFGAFAWSGHSYVRLKRDELKRKNFDNFFITIERVHNASGSLISQQAAIFELRNYPEYRDVILRICGDSRTLFGPNPDQRVMDEFNETAEYLRNKK